LSNSYITEAISMPSSFEQLRTTSAGNNVRILVDHIVNNVTNPAIVNALLYEPQLIWEHIC